MGADPLEAIEPNELRRARLRARIAAQDDATAPVGDGQMTGLLAAETNPAPPAVVPNSGRGWRRVAMLDVSAVLGL